MAKDQRETVYHFEKSQIYYLAFEGGGGKGIAFLGAIAALEEENVLGSGSNSQIKGISGTSAGSITAFLVALGINVNRLAAILSNEKTFIDFYDGPNNSKIRAIIRNTSGIASSGRFIKNTAPGEGESLMKFESLTVKQRKIVMDLLDEFPLTLPYLRDATSLGIGATFLSSMLISIGADNNNNALKNGAIYSAGFSTPFWLGGILINHLLGAHGIKSWLQNKTNPTENPSGTIKKSPFEDLVKQLTTDEEIFKKYISNLLLDRGLFPGFKLREFFQKNLNESILFTSPENPSFETFLEKTKIDLRIVSVNSTTHRPQVFSEKTTPKFPVIDAIGMSSSFPFAFKPVLVRNCRIGDLGPPDGIYLDGGVIVNLPLHKFNEDGVAPLNENMLAFRLETLHPENEIDEDSGNDKKEVFDIVRSYAGDLMNTFLFHTEEGQFRTPAERKQTVEIDVTGLETLQFVAPIEKSGPKIIDAYLKTKFILDKNFKVYYNNSILYDPNNHYKTVDNIGFAPEANRYEYDTDKFIELEYDTSKIASMLNDANVGEMMKDLKKGS